MYFAPDRMPSASGLAAYSLAELKVSRSVQVRSDHSESSISSDMDIPRCINVVADGLRSMLSPAVRFDGPERPRPQRLRPRHVPLPLLDLDPATGFLRDAELVPHDFITGLLQLNRDSLQARRAAGHASIHGAQISELVMTMRSRLLFGADAVPL